MSRTYNKHVTNLIQQANNGSTSECNISYWESTQASQSAMDYGPGLDGLNKIYKPNHPTPSA